MFTMDGICMENGPRTAIVKHKRVMFGMTSLIERMSVNRGSWKWTKFLPIRLHIPSLWQNKIVCLIVWI